MCASVFGDAVDYGRARVANRRWAFFQPANTTMAPMGTIHFHPRSGIYHEDFSTAPLGLQGLFVHEMAHVWQTQRAGRFYLLMMRHPFCRYRYAFQPGKPFARYGIEQQAEIVRHAFLLRRGAALPDAPPLEALAAILPPGFALRGA